MPMITVRYVTPKARPELRPRSAALAARLGAEQLGKDQGVTAVLVAAAALAFAIAKFVHCAVTAVASSRGRI